MIAIRPESELLGKGAYRGAVGQALRAALVPDEWSSERIWRVGAAFNKPLLRCLHVFQMISDADSPMRTGWQHEPFCRLNGQLGGKFRTAPRLDRLLERLEGPASVSETSLFRVPPPL